MHSRTSIPTDLISWKNQGGAGSSQREARLDLYSSVSTSGAQQLAANVHSRPCTSVPVASPVQPALPAGRQAAAAGTGRAWFGAAASAFAPCPLPLAPHSSSSRPPLHSLQRLTLLDLLR